MTMNRKNAPITSTITAVAVLGSLFAGLAFNQRTSAQASRAETTRSRQRAEGDYPTLTKYGTELTSLALKGKLEPVREHDADVARVIASLAATNERNPVVVGESDLDRDTVARGVALKIAFGDVPETLRDKLVFRVSLDALARGAQTSAEFAARVQSLVAEAVKADGRVILFLDQLHQYAGSHATSTASATIRDAIVRNHLRLIGGASPTAYASYIASDDAVTKLFESIAIDKLNQTAAAETLKDKRRSPINEEFVGDNISLDMRDLMKSAGQNGRVSAILQ